MRIALWSSAASVLTPQRRSIAWKLQPRSWQCCCNRGNTSACSALRSTFRSLKVELTKRRMVREDSRMAARESQFVSEARQERRIGICKRRDLTGRYSDFLDLRETFPEPRCTVMRLE